MANPWIERVEDVREVLGLLRRFPVVAVLGARQVGKTTLAKQVLRRWRGPSASFDLEWPEEAERLAVPMLALEPLRGLVVLDEVHRAPGIFQILRVLADRRPLPARFLVLGSASPNLLQQASESLAGRIVEHHLRGLGLGDVGERNLSHLWLRGGFPPSYLASEDARSLEWRRGFLRSFLERDVPEFGVQIPSRTLLRFWTMLAHSHGQVLNASDLGRSLGVAHTTIRRYLDLLESLFMVRQLLPFHANVAKRQVKAPKVYVADSGLLHALLDLESADDLSSHPKMGASWEGFLLDEVVRRLRAWPERCYYWGTHAAGELDLVVTRGTRPYGFEFKRTDAPRVTPFLRSAIRDLGLARLDIVHGGRETFPIDRTIRAVAACRIREDIEPLR